MRILSENPIDGVWEMLSQWESIELAKKILSAKATKQNVKLEPRRLDKKAQALAYCIRNARENIRSTLPALTTAATLNYYGCMWLAAAVAVSQPDSDADLEKLELTTTSGHGLGNIVEKSKQFPDNEFVYIKSGGFFIQYLRWIGYGDQSRANYILSPAKRPKNVEDLTENEKTKLISVMELFARIPEITQLYENVSDGFALNFQVFYDGSKNHQENQQDMLSTVYASAADLKPHIRNRDYTWLGLQNALKYPLEHLQKYGPPMEELEIRDLVTDKCWTGKFKHPAGREWGNEPAFYKSALSPTSWVSPVLGDLADPLAVHLMLLYQLSIFSRYRPAVWREVVEGSLDQYKMLITAYFRSFARIIPEFALSRILDEPLDVVMPGSLFAPL